MKERPILFSGAMVKAILAGRKTQTRRVVKMNEPFPHHNSWPVVDYARDGMPIFWSSPPPAGIRGGEYCEHGKPCPYGVPGDLLWIRETWGIAAGNLEYLALRYRADDARRIIPGKTLADVNGNWAWRPSIHMPRWASRLTLAITQVRAERLQAITEAEAEAEGVDAIPSAPAALSHRTSFAGLWDKLNAKRGFPWSSNPWVWVVTFRRIDL